MLSSADSIRKLRRVHGFQLPLHPLQVSGWLTIASLSAGSFLVVIPALPLHWQPASSAALSTLLLLHLAANLGASLVDPAEPALRKIVPEPIPELDRSKHAHVIEEGRCHLCKIRTSTERTKHCGACNKCVERFDHHCKWLNHCVGARNYVPFLMCVSTAVGAAAFVAILAISQLVLHQKETGWFTKPENITLPTHSSLPSGDAAFLAIVAILGLLAAVTAGLLLHLCFFHIYISFLGLTTYEYIRQNKIPQPPQTQTEETDQNEESSSACSNLRHRPADLFCHGRSRMTVFTCTVIEETVSCAEPTPTPPSTPQDCHTCVVMNNSVVPDKVLPNKRVKQKWNCCVSVPDSPESPLEPKCLMSLCRHKSRVKSKIPAIEGRPHRTHGHWSSAKLRVLFRVLGNFGNNRGRHQKGASAKNNQVVPLSHDSNSTNEQTPIQTITNLVPVPSIPDHRHPILPALPPPQRRRMISDVELTNALTILQQQQHHQQQRCLGRRPLLPQYRRRRRSNVHRTKTPALSPIRESGLSNPASPSRQNCTLTTANCPRPF